MANDPFDGLDKDPIIQDAMMRMIENKREVELRIPVFGAWILMSTLQMTLTHPNVGEAVKGICAFIAQQLEEKILVLYPELAPLAKKGWDRK